MYLGMFTPILVLFAIPAVMCIWIAFLLAIDMEHDIYP